MELVGGEGAFLVLLKGDNGRGALEPPGRGKPPAPGELPGLDELAGPEELPGGDDLPDQMVDWFPGLLFGPLPIDALARFA